ncbi:MAG TPA: LysM peptidoglycan-binding domain-containing protein [Frateuria sp.]|uniref:LysM peptidoglycan-binding domain-containing protein n=1 Tax=Frateuria sp. TaxID=2211372 RepID=UPI002DEBFE12|nr:LysM peptidoglycan-binding domain-containing protein [Frateuria sp.]
MKHLLRPLPLALAMALTACAVGPSRPRAPGVEPPKAEIHDITTAKPTSPTATAGSDVWGRLRGSFVMADCAGDPGIEAWARRYTASPQRFESQMRTVLPRLLYVQEIAARHEVPGEFALLPWVESHFRPVPPQKNRPAGMWQIVPNTARHMGLAVDRNYDARLDLTASTDAVMALLSHYHDWFQDWRLADYAYNAGRDSIDRLVARDGAPPREQAVPAMPVRAGTREHLVKLLAIACVVREPERFGVTLPVLEDEQQLVEVAVTQRLSLDKAARLTGMSPSTLASLNAGYRNGVVDARRGGSLLLPSKQAAQLRTALLAQAAGGSADLMASVGAAPALPNLGDDPSAATRQPENVPPPPAPAAKATVRTHVVKAGDTLLKIAQRYHVRVAQLRQWNHLHGDAIQVGQKLAVSATH